MTDFKGKELNIGDKVIFCISDNILAEGTITKFYGAQFKNCDACSIKVPATRYLEERIIRNIYSKRIFKVEE